MNTISEFRRGWKRSVAAACLALCGLTSCIQGPWDYDPTVQAPYRGIWVNGFIYGNVPVRSVCFERLRSLNEAYPDTTPFYQEADVRITGGFGDSGSIRSVALGVLPDSPNCFAGPETDTIMPGASYMLSASLTWDSSGRTVTSLLKGTAHVPSAFSVRRQAAGPGLSGPIPYRAGDTIDYVPDGANRRFHYFRSDHSDDVGCVLVALRTESPENIRTIGLHPNAPGPKGYNQIDSIRVANHWIAAGENSLRFHALEPAYLEFVRTAVQREKDPTVAPVYNLDAGAGIFAGAMIDSFDVFVRKDSNPRL